MSESYARLKDLDPHAFSRARSVVSRQVENFPEEALHVIANEVIARVLAQHNARVRGYTEPSMAQIDEFCDALVSPNENDAAKMMDDVRDHGGSLELIYLGYLAGAARRMGERWENDTANFVDVTLATGRIYSIMRGLSKLFGPKTPLPKRKAIFASVPGETHSLGISMATDMLEQRGWEIDLLVDRSHEDLLTAIQAADHTIVGLSASKSESIVPLARLCVALRISTPHVFIMVGGHLTTLETDIGTLIDVDLTTNDAFEAAERLEMVVARL